MRVYATEICDPADSGVGWGIKIVTDGLAACGVPVEVVPILDPTPRPLPDVWLLSMPFAGNAAQLAGFFAWAGIEMDAAKRHRAPFLLMGGHAVVNVEPFLDVADAVFVGEADDQIPALAAALLSGDLDALSLVPGVCMDRTSEVWFQVASSLERRGFYGAAMGEAGSGVGETTYLEVARGCKAGCRFCEIGWNYGYTERTREETEALMAQVEAKKTLILSAPDTDGVSWFADMIADGAYVPRWRSTRVVPYLKSPHPGKENNAGRIRFGVEGVTERLRRLVGKPITDEEFLAALHRASREGTRMFRVFLIAGLPTETPEDRRHLDHLIRIASDTKKVRHWKALDWKITGLSPQPLTPFQRFGVKGALEALEYYRRHRIATQQAAPGWRSVMPDSQATEADVIKRMLPGELLAYLKVRGAGPIPGSANARWEQVRRWALEAGIDYDTRVLEDTPLHAALPWRRTRHTNEGRVQRQERKTWEQVDAYLSLGLDLTQDARRPAKRPPNLP